MAYTRRESDGANATPMRPSFSDGRPAVTCFHVSPPSSERQRPVPGPLEGGYTFQGGLRVCQSAASIVDGREGSNARSIAPVSRSFPSTCFHVRPPSFERH